jgi:hypothetical protein
VKGTQITEEQIMTAFAKDLLHFDDDFADPADNETGMGEGTMIQKPLPIATTGAAGQEEYDRRLSLIECSMWCSAIAACLSGAFICAYLILSWS